MPGFAVEALHGLTGRLVWLGLLNSLWIGLFVASLVALVFHAGPRLTHQLRHAVLVIALLLVALGPVGVTVLQQVGASRPARNNRPSPGLTVLVSFSRTIPAEPDPPSARSPLRASQNPVVVQRF